MCSLAMHAETENIRIMSYNIPKGNILVEEGNGQNTWENRAQAIHRYFATVKPDLIGMQEPVHTSLADMLRGMPNYAMVGTGRDNGAEKGEFTAILYRTDRFYCLANDTYWLTETPKVHSKVDGSTHFRIATWALFEDKATGARFLYTNTHLSYDSPKVKDAQLRILKPTMLAVQKQYGSSLPHFLTGDFNMKDNENVDGTVSARREGSNYLLTLNMSLVLKEVWATVKQKKHFSGALDDLHIDYIFISKNVSSRYAQWDNREDADGFIMSDHNPVWADIYFTTSVEDNARAAINKAWSEIDSTYVLLRLNSRLITSSSQLTTDGTQSGYPVSNVIDSNTDTYCQSSTGVPPHQPHYLQVQLKHDITDCRFMYYRRKDNTEGNADRWLDVMVTASDDGNNWDYITAFNNFAGTTLKSYASDNISLHRPYKYLRFSVMHTPNETLRNGNPQFSLSEFQLYENKRSTESPRFLDEQVGAAANTVEELIATTKGLIEAGTIKRADVTALQEATQALREARLAYTSGISLPVAEQHSSQFTSIYGLSGRRQSSLQHGVNILREGDGTVRKVLIR